MVRSRRLELPRPFGHSDLNAARLPVPPRPHVIAAGEGPALAGAGPLAKPPGGCNGLPPLPLAGEGKVRVLRRLRENEKRKGKRRRPSPIPLPRAEEEVSTGTSACLRRAS